VHEVLTIAGELGSTPGQVAMASLREKAAASRTGRVAIVGPRTLGQLREYLGSLEVWFEAEQTARLDKASAIRHGQPYEIVADRVTHVTGSDGWTSACR
jgi:aryl-alcohol dehydrogenase-like predicted oxidoreductase